MSKIRQLTWQPAGAVARPVEVMTFDRLRTLNDGRTQRADFNVLAVIQAGHGSVSIDFSSYPLIERTAMWIAPGAVHRWDQMADVAGHVVLFVPTAPVTPPPGSSSRRRTWSPDGASRPISGGW